MSPNHFGGIDSMSCLQQTPDYNPVLVIFIRHRISSAFDLFFCMVNIKELIFEVFVFSIATLAVFYHIK